MIDGSGRGGADRQGGRRNEETLTSGFTSSFILHPSALLFAALVFVHRFVRLREEFFDRGRVGGLDASGAEAQRQLIKMSVLLVEVAEIFLQAFGQQNVAVGDGMSHEDRELVAADASDDVGLAAGLLNDVGRLDQRL